MLYGRNNENWKNTNDYIMLQKDITVIIYLTMLLTGKRKATPTGIIKVPRKTSMSDNLYIINLSAKSLATMLHKMVATANALFTSP